MKYILNKGRYDKAFFIEQNGREKKVVFMRRRFYLDTGNIAMSGITEIDEETLKLLKKNKRFAENIKSGDFEVTNINMLNNSEKTVDLLQQENEQLKKELEETKNKKDNAKVSKELKAKDDEIKSLKAQLEALGNKQAEDF